MSECKQVTYMKKNTLLKNVVLFICSLCLAATTARAVDKIKADNADNLNLGTSWVSGSPPTSADVGVWNGTVIADNTTSLGADTNWAGIRIANPGGPVTILAGNTLFNGAAGMDLSAATQDLTLNNNVDVSAPQTWSVGAGRTLTINTPLSGAAANGLTKNGSGTLALGATVNGTYAGGTTINAGVLQLNGANANNNSALGTGAITNNGATIRFAAARILGNAIHFVGNCIVDCNGFGAPLDGAWSCDPASVVLITNLPSGQTFTIGGNGNGGGNMNNFTGTIKVDDLVAGTVRFNNGGGNNAVGNVNAVFDLGNGTATMISRNSTTINLGELRGGEGTQLSGQGSGNGMTVWSIGAMGTSTTFAGSITDSTATRTNAIAKVGSGRLILTGTNNSYTAGTTISGGTLQVGNGGLVGQLGGWNVVINNGANLVYNRFDDIERTNPISTSSSGNVIKSNFNTLTYHGTNNSSGINFLVNEGTLQVADTTLIAGKVSVAGAAFFSVSNAPAFVFDGTLAGTGTVGTNFVSGSNAKISPGDDGVAGKLNFVGGLKINGGTYNADLSNDPNSSTANDRIAVTGDLDVSGGTNLIAVNTLTSLPPGTNVYTVITYTGSLIGGTTNFQSSVGTVTNPPGAIALRIVVQRAATNLTWVGDGGANNWDNGVSATWRSALAPAGPAFTFLLNDNARFENVGGTNPTVNIVGSVTPNSVTVNSATNYTFTGSGSILGGSGLSKSNSGTLTILTTNDYTGPTVIAGGTLVLQSVANGGAASPIGAATTASSNLVFVSSKLVYQGTSTSTDRGATLAGSGVNVEVTGSSDILTNAGVLTGAGGLVKSGPGTLALSSANDYTGGVIISNGVLAMASQAANNAGATSGLGSTNNTVTFRGGTLQIFGYNGGTGNNFNTVYNPLVVPVGETGTLRMFPRGPVNSGNGAGLQSSLTGGGTLNLVVNYVRDDLSGDWSAFNGLINVTAKTGADEMRVNNNFGYSNATINLNDGVSLCRSFTANTTNDIGALTGTSLAVLGTGDNSGANTTWRIGSLGGNTTFAGTINNGNGTRVIKVGAGTWELSGANGAAATIVSNGVLVVSGSFSGANISVASGAFLDVRPIGTLFLGFGQTLGGNGQVWGSVDTTGGGTIAPGFSTGILNVTNTVNLGGDALMELNRGASPNSDRLVAPSITYGGTLTVTNIGARLQMNDIFDLFDGPFSSTFSTVVLPNYYTWDTSNLYVNGTIRVTAYNPPKINAMTLTPTDVTLSATNGVAGGSLLVLTSTNVALPVAQWTSVETNNFDGSGNFTSQPIPVNPATSRQFYLIQAF